MPRIDNKTMLAGLDTRLARIEDRLFGNGESIIERLTRIEAAQEQLAAKLDGQIEEQRGDRAQLVQEAILEAQESMRQLLSEQVTAQNKANAMQLKSNRIQIVGLWIGLGSLIIGFIATKVFGI